MRNRKSQTATEYLVILAVVIVIAIVVTNLLGGFPSLGGGVSENRARSALLSAEIGIEAYSVSDYDTMLRVKNNKPFGVIIDKIEVNGEECLFFYGTIHQLGVGQTKDIQCQNVYELSSSRVSWPIVIT
ncbi:MAG: hypothetical protein ACMXYK_01175 [Candidatus Woesearchaeota archaeon]